MGIIEQATMLQLGGQLSLRAFFCDALASMNKYQIHDIREVENIYRLIIGDCSNEYRYHVTTLNSARNLTVQLDFGKYPPCSQGFTKVICMEANYGLVHKKSSGLGQGLGKSRHENSYFMNQDHVDSFVDSYSDPKRSEKNGKNDILDWVSFCVPVFHSFAHNMSYQLQYGQRNVTGTGLTDGEGMERLWSYLRRFSKITKEMNLDNRQDLLVDALFHYSEKLKLKLCSRLEQKHLPAIEQKTNSLKSLKKLIRASMEEINQWAGTKKSKYTSQTQIQRDNIDALPENAQDDEIMLKSQLERLEKNLVLAEKKMNLAERWTVTNENFQLHLKPYREKKKNSLIKILKEPATERTFLLPLMKTYADN